MQGSPEVFLLISHKNPARWIFLFQSALYLFIYPSLICKHTHIHTHMNLLTYLLDAHYGQTLYWAVQSEPTLSLRHIQFSEADGGEGGREQKYKS